VIAITQLLLEYDLIKKSSTPNRWLCDSPTTVRVYPASAPLRVLGWDSNIGTTPVGIETPIER